MNLLVALAWPSHVHHRTAVVWFGEHRKWGWATCPLTQSAFIRVSSNRKVFPDAKSPREAAALLRRIIALPDHVFWQDDVSLPSAPEIDLSRLVGYLQVTDLHLLALARRRGGRLATLDSGIASLIPGDVERERVLVEVR